MNCNYDAYGNYTCDNGSISKIIEGLENTSEIHKNKDLIEGSRLLTLDNKDLINKNKNLTLDNKDLIKGSRNLTLDNKDLINKNNALINKNNVLINELKDGMSALTSSANNPINDLLKFLSYQPTPTN